MTTTNAVNDHNSDCKANAMMMKDSLKPRSEPEKRRERERQTRR